MAFGQRGKYTWGASGPPPPALTGRGDKPQQNLEDTTVDNPFQDDTPGDGGLTAVVEPKKLPEKSAKRKGIPKYHVVLWDDDDHTAEYVETMLRELFGHTQEDCVRMVETVDTEGRVIVLTTTKEHAELKRDQVHAYGKDDVKGCKGSMTASIEPAE